MDCWQFISCSAPGAALAFHNGHPSIHPRADQHPTAAGQNVCPDVRGFPGTAGFAGPPPNPQRRMMSFTSNKTKQNQTK